MISLHRAFLKWTVLPTVVCASLLWTSTAAVATPLLVNSAIAATNTPGTLGGTPVANTGALPFSSATFNGTLTSGVLLNDPANPYGAGNYTFTYLLTSNANSSDNMSRLSVPGYGIAGLLTDATFSTLAAGIAPTSFSRTSGLGDVIGVNYSVPNALSAGMSSELIVIHTNSNQISEQTASIIDGSTGQVPTYAPLAVPEPAGFMLGVCGLAGLATFIRRRFTI